VTVVRKLGPNSKIGFIIVKTDSYYKPFLIYLTPYITSEICLYVFSIVRQQF
jgi:hypothetical protein